jgi:dienelactone hydrolase
MRSLLFQDDAIFWYQTQRVFGSMFYGGADFNETVTTAERIAAGDYDSWKREWAATAERIEEEARAELTAGHPVSARDGLMRATTYWRSAEFFTRDRKPDPDGESLHSRHVQCFRDATALMDASIEPVEIPFEGTTLNGYLYTPAAAGLRPLLIIHTGYDGTAEEMYLVGARGAQERGYAVLAFDGPGQPGPRYRDGLVFRPEWETVVGPVIDWAEQQPGIDPSRIALTGNSMGGELAPRAAAYEPRIHALLCIDGVYDFGGTVARGILGPNAALRLQTESDEHLDEAIERLMAKNTTARWVVRNGMWSFGSDTPTAFLRSVVEYNLRDGIAERIACPVFVGRGESDEFLRGQPEELMKHLNAPATLVNFTDAEGAGSHCQGGAKSLLVARSLDWLDDTL